MFTIPANIEKTFDQISNAVGHVFRCGAFPVIHSGGVVVIYTDYPTSDGVATGQP